MNNIPELTEYEKNYHNLKYKINKLEFELKILKEKLNEFSTRYTPHVHKINKDIKSFPINI